MERRRSIVEGEEELFGEAHGEHMCEAPLPRDLLRRQDHLCAVAATLQLTKDRDGRDLGNGWRILRECRAGEHATTGIDGHGVVIECQGDVLGGAGEEQLLGGIAIHERAQLQHINQLSAPDRDRRGGCAVRCARLSEERWSGGVGREGQAGFCEIMHEQCINTQRVHRKSLVRRTVRCGTADAILLDMLPRFTRLLPSALVARSARSASSACVARVALVALVALATVPPLLAAQGTAADSAARAARADSARRVAAVRVTITRTDAQADVAPWAVGVVTTSQLRDGRATLGVDEALSSVPGVVVSNRYNYSVDQRISIRGAGARANFGMRGVKVLLDGVPQSLPDGQSQLTNIDLGDIARVEVLRGSASSLYGNGSGGVIAFTTDLSASDPFATTLRTTAGSFGLRKWQSRTSGRTGNMVGSLSMSRTTVDGARQYSNADLRQLMAATDWSLANGVTLALRTAIASEVFNTVQIRCISSLLSITCIL